MTATVAGEMIAAEILKLRRHRTTMATALFLSIGVTVLYLAAIRLRHHHGFDPAQVIANGTALMGIYFGSFAAILIGTEAATIDLANGVFRDLVATGRSRTALFAVRLAAAILVALAFTLSGFLLTVLAAFAFSGNASAPDIDLILRSAGWVALATAAETAFAVGIGSLTGSRSLTLTAVIGWQTIATSLVYAAEFLGSARNGVLLIALGRLQPGPDFGTRDLPGSSNALPGYHLPMSVGVAVLVIAAWAVVLTIAGAWGNRERDA